MLLQTNSYIVPKEKRGEHARLMARFRHLFRRLGSDFEVYEQTGTNFTGEGGGRFVQIMRFRDRRHQQEVHAREATDAVAQRLIAEFCDLVNLPYQQQQGLFAAAYYSSVLRPTASSPHGEVPDVLPGEDAEELAGFEEPEHADLEGGAPRTAGGRSGTIARHQAVTGSVEGEGLDDFSNDDVNEPEFDPGAETGGGGGPSHRPARA